YPAELFDPELIQTLRLIPTEYLFFYYSQRTAHRNQVRAGVSRGEELERLNRELFRQLSGVDARQGVAAYRAYLLRRNASYMKLEYPIIGQWELAGKLRAALVAGDPEHLGYLK